MSTQVSSHHPIISVESIYQAKVRLKGVVKRPGDYEALLARMDKHRISYQTLNDEQTLFELLI